MERMCRRIGNRVYRNAYSLENGMIVSAGVLLLAVIPPVTMPPVPVARMQWRPPEAGAPAMIPQWNFGAPLAMTPQAITPPSSALLIPNWEVGRNAIQVLPNYQAGMGKFVLVEDGKGELAPPQAPTFSARPTLSPQPYPVSPVVQSPVFGRLTSEPSAASQ